MPVWRVVMLLNLTLAVGLGLGYGAWGRRTDALDREVDAVRTQVERLERERQACAGGARAGEQQWEGRGIVRAVHPQLLVITHEEIRGLLPARTTGFRVVVVGRSGPHAGGRRDPILAAGHGGRRRRARGDRPLVSGRVQALVSPRDEASRKPAWCCARRSSRGPSRLLLARIVLRIDVGHVEGADAVDLHDGLDLGVGVVRHAGR